MGRLSRHRYLALYFLPSLRKPVGAMLFAQLQILLIYISQEIILL